MKENVRVSIFELQFVIFAIAANFIGNLQSASYNADFHVFNNTADLKSK